MSDPYDPYPYGTIPFVYFANYLSSPTGPQVAGNYLMGYFSSITLPTDTVYDVIGALRVPSDVTLNISSGDVFRFHAGSDFKVDGAIKVSGTSVKPVRFTSGKAAPARGDWPGINLRAGIGSIIDNAVIEFADSGVTISGTAGIVKNTFISKFKTQGIYVQGVLANGTLLQSNIIDNVDKSATCIATVDSSPGIVGNTLKGCKYGLQASWTKSSTSVLNVTGNNVITENMTGVYLGRHDLNPNINVTGNQIFGNVEFNFYTYPVTYSGGVIKLNATGNWWGTTDASVIAAGIYDFGSVMTNVLPIVDFSGFLNGPSGAPKADNYIVGVQPTRNLVSNTTYQVLGALVVPAGTTFTVPAGVVLNFHGEKSRLIVDGTLLVSGEKNKPVKFTSGKAQKNKGDWQGVVINNKNTNISYTQIEYSTIAVQANKQAYIANNSIENFSEVGVSVFGYFPQEKTTIVRNTIKNNDNLGGCVLLSLAYADLAGNSIQGCEKGISIRSSSRVSDGGLSIIGDGNEITNNKYGVYFWGDGDPAAKIQGNNISNNDLFNVYAGISVSLNVDARSNWWGSVDPAVIANSIYDYYDFYDPLVRGQLVDFADYLVGPGGASVSENILTGYVNSSRVLNPSETYSVANALIVDNWKSFEIPAGVTFKFYKGVKFEVHGSLNVNGTSASPVLFTSAKKSPEAGDWSGIEFRKNSGGGAIKYANVEYAEKGILLDQVSSAVSVIGSTIRYFNGYGIDTHKYFSSASVFSNNTVEGENLRGTCIHLVNGSPTVSGNRLKNCNYGLSLEMIVAGSMTPTVNGNNIITNNNYGVSVKGFTTKPVITGNQLFNNGIYNYYASYFSAGAQNTLLNATGNWWGSVDPSKIAASIYDLSDSVDSTTLPLVDYSNYLNGPNGTSVSGNYLLGQLGTSTTLTSGSTYNVLGALFVPAGKTLTIPSGTTLKFSGGAPLIVNGVVSVNGTSSSPVMLTSGNSSPVKGDWGGIDIRSGTGSIVEYATIEYAKNAINVSGVAATIRNNTIRKFVNGGISVSGAGASASVIQNNSVNNSDATGTCLRLENASASVSGNSLTYCNYGLSINMTQAGSMTPNISGKNVIAKNNYGVYVLGSGVYIPLPVVIGNQILNNTNYNFYTDQFGSGALNKNLNATGNWWGSSDPTIINKTIFDLNDSVYSTTIPSVDYRGFLNGPNGILFGLGFSAQKTPIPQHRLQAHLP